MGLKLDFAEGQTPLDDEEKMGLLISTIATRGELDEFEQQNIETAIHWLIGRKLRAEQIFTETFIQEIHKRMYSQVWKWAGEFRTTNKNMGVDFWQIAIELKKLLDDARYWTTHQTFLPDEIAIRFKHRLVSIHCFPNGNGRHSRLMADIIIEKIYSLPLFSWGGNQLVPESEVRLSYITALKAADNGNYDLLLVFARS